MSPNVPSLETYEKQSEIAEIQKLLRQADDLIRWGSWTLAADLAEQAGAKARALREREVAEAVRQEELALSSPSKHQQTALAL